MKEYVETAKADDGFIYEIWRRLGIQGGIVYYPVCQKTKTSLLGGCLQASVDEVKLVMNLIK